MKIIRFCCVPTWFAACVLLLFWQSVYADVPVTVAECDTTAGNFGGHVFRDYDSNGIRALLEPGVGGVSVTAYDSSNQVVAKASTTASGNYSLMGLTDGRKYRIEFTDLPSGYDSGAEGNDSQSSVRFETAGTRCNVDLGILLPAQYCQATPDLATPVFLTGDLVTGGNAGHTAMISVNAGWGQYAVGTDATPHTSDKSFWQPADKTPRQLAIGSQIGAVYGVAWDASQQYLYASAYQKYQADYGPGGPGQIYRIPMNPLTGQATGAPEQWVNIETDYGISVCGGHGTDLINQYDTSIFSLTGKCSLGDLDLSEDRKTLYVVNLTTKEIIGIDTATKAKVGQWAFPANQATCKNAPADVRPFGLKYHNGKLYVGAVCSAETSNVRSDLRAYVYSLDSTGNWTSELYYDWSHQRYSIYGTQLDPWLSNMDQVYYTRFQHGTPKNWVTNNSQMLTDIEFVGDDMILGFRGRFADQWGNDITYERSDVSKAPYTANTVGDIVCVAYDKTTQTYQWETNDHVNNLGICGDRTASHSGYVHPDTDYDLSNTDVRYHNDLLDDGEFYWGDGGAPIFGTAARHFEISLGGIAQYGVAPLVMGALTPPNALGVGYDQSAGIVWLDNSTGGPTGAYVAYDATDTGTFSKAAGLGDIEAMCLLAPVEVGNRVWRDTNGNGIQDADEKGIDGIAVNLSCGTYTATTTTANGGNFLFSNTTGGDAYFMASGDHCSLGINTTQPALAGYKLTGANLDGQTDNDPMTDLRDSDGVIQSNNAIVTFAVGDAGENNHTLDFGFIPVYSIGNRIWIDANDNGLADMGESAVGAGVQLELKDSSGIVLQTTSTDANGRYLFYGLLTGDYQVCLSADNFAIGGVLEGYRSSTGFTDANLTNVDGDDSGDDTINDGVCSTVVTLDNTEPTGEAGVTGNNDGDDGQGTPDSSSNLTVDFGVVPPSADLEVQKTADKSSVKAGDTVRYTITVTNKGPDTAVSIEIVDNLPARITYDPPYTASQGTYTPATGIWAVGSLAKGASATLMIDGTVN